MEKVSKKKSRRISKPKTDIANLLGAAPKIDAKGFYRQKKREIQ